MQVESQKQTLVARCRICSDKTELQVCPDDLKSWENNNVHIQDALPYLNAAERELILTGTCGKCFDEMTGVFK
jgi:hypothetical protein